MRGCTDGVYEGRRYFQCLPERGYFCRINDLQPLDEYSSLSSTAATSAVGGAAPTNPPTAGAVHSFTNRELCSVSDGGLSEHSLYSLQLWTSSHSM